MITIGDIACVIESRAPLRLQENYDNAGLLIGRAERECRGVLLTVDVTPAVVEEARRRGLNLIVAHHPLIFRGVKHLTASSPVEEAVEAAIKNDIAVYAAHTNMDNAPSGVSAEMGEMLGLRDMMPLSAVPGESGDTGCGVVGNLAEPLTGGRLIEKVKEAFGSLIVRCTAFNPDAEMEKVALCGGSGAFLIPDAVGSGAQAFITSDTKYHDFVDWGSRIFIIDIGHHESENCSKNIFYRIITEKFPNFAVEYSLADTNPINYL